MMRLDNLKPGALYLHKPGLMRNKGFYMFLEKIPAEVEVDEQTLQLYKAKPEKYSFLTPDGQVHSYVTFYVEAFMEKAK